jgi:hypothetical protein
MRKVMSMTAAVLAIAAMPAVAQSMSGSSQDKSTGGGVDTPNRAQTPAGSKQKTRQQGSSVPNANTAPGQGNYSDRYDTQSNIDHNMRMENNPPANTATGK